MAIGGYVIPWSMIAAIGVTGVLMITLYSEFIRPWRVARAERKRHASLEARREKIQQTDPELDAKILWGPPGQEEQLVEEVHLESKASEFFYFRIKNKSEDKVYNLAIDAHFPPGFEILKDGDNRLTRSQLGRTKSFIQKLVGGSQVSYHALPSFGTLDPDPPQIRHDRRRAVSGYIPNRGPGGVGLHPFWIRTPDAREYRVDVTWHVIQSVDEVGDVQLSDYEKSFRIIVEDKD